MTSLRLVPSLCLASLLVLAAGCGNGDAELADAARPALQARAAEQNPEPLPKLGEAPAWELTRIDGTTLSSEELKGKVVVVDFWATWCPPCREEIPGYIELQKQYGDRGLVIVGISLDQAGPKVVQEFAKRYGINYPIVMGDQDVVSAFGDIRGIPTTFLIDREGQIRHRKVGAMARSDYEPIVTSLL